MPEHDGNETGISAVHTALLPQSESAAYIGGPEVAALVDRLTEGGAKYLHVDWVPGVAKLSAEERAAELNAVFAEMAHPLTGLAGKLEGDAFLLRDTIRCTRNRHDVSTGDFVKVPPTPEEETLLRSIDRAVASLSHAANRLRELALSTPTHAGKGLSA